MKNLSLVNQNELVDHIISSIKSDPSIVSNEKRLRQKIFSILNDIYNIKQQAKDCEVTILLSDIRGFTELSESLPAIDVVIMLNHYFHRMNQIINSYGGVIDKYMGDAIMVLFGVPESQDDDIQRAIACAVEMQIAMEQVNKKNIRKGFPELFIGIGINTGKVSLGQVGSELHQEYTVIGDEVNLASRIESHSLRGQLLISEHTFSKAKNYIETGCINKVRVKGKKNKVKLYEIISTKWPVSLEVPEREIRTSPRIDINTYFEFQVLQEKKILPEIHTGYISDISYNGLFALSDSRFEPGAIIKLSFSLSLFSRKTTVIYAKLKSIRKINKAYGYGIEYTDIDEDSKLVIKEFVDRIIECS